MKFLRIVIPVIIIAFLTALAICSALWLTGLVPAGPWSELIKAAIVIFIIGSTLVTVAWSAYFTYVIRVTIEELLSKED